jgi:hypothetical protein
MYAWKSSFAIDGKAMYFGGEERTSDAGLRPSNARKSATDLYGFAQIWRRRIKRS